MSKKLATKIETHINALAEVENDLANAYRGLDKRTKAAKQALTTMKQAKALCEALKGVWKRSSKEIAALAKKPDFAPINGLLMEVIAVKAQATQRRRVEKAKAVAKAFSLQERARFRNERGDDHATA